MKPNLGSIHPKQGNLGLISYMSASENSSLEIKTRFFSLEKVNIVFLHKLNVTWTYFMKKGPWTDWPLLSNYKGSIYYFFLVIFWFDFSFSIWSSFLSCYSRYFVLCQSIANFSSTLNAYLSLTKLTSGNWHCTGFF